MGNAHSTPAVVLTLSINGLGVARSLGRHDVPVIGMSSGRVLPGAYSRYVKEIWRYEGDDHNLVEVLLERGGRQQSRPALFPITDATVLAIADRLDELRKYYAVAMPEVAAVRTAMSKFGFAELAARYDLPVPKSVWLKEESQRQDVEPLTYPCILKPEFRSPEFAKAAAQKAFHVDDPAQLWQAYQSFRHAAPRAIVQEWISGGDGDVYFCLQYYNRRSEPLVTFCGRKIRQWPPLCGGTASCEPADVPELEELTTRFFTAIGFQGLCSMEYKRNRATGRFVMVEPTVARTDWQSAVADINGVEIPYVAYCDMVGEPLPQFRRTARSYKWVRWSADRASAAYYRRNGRLGWRDWLWSIRPPLRWAVWSIHDPAPLPLGYLQQRFERLKQIARGVLRRAKGRRG